MPASTVPIFNPSSTNALRVLESIKHETDWLPPRAIAVIQPLSGQDIALNDTRRIVLEPTSSEDVQIEIVNRSLYQPLRLSTSESHKRGEFEEPNHFVTLASKNRATGACSSSAVAANAKRRLILELCPT